MAGRIVIIILRTIGALLLIFGLFATYITWAIDPQILKNDWIALAFIFGASPVFFLMAHLMKGLIEERAKYAPGTGPKYAKPELPVERIGAD
jgi:hypothetical protein